MVRGQRDHGGSVVHVDGLAQRKLVEDYVMIANSFKKESQRTRLGVSAGSAHSCVRHNGVKCQQRSQYQWPDIGM